MVEQLRRCTNAWRAVARPLDERNRGSRGEEGTSPRRRRETTMTDKISQLRLSAGTVPDPFGLAWDPAHEMTDEDEPDPAGPGSTATDDTDVDEDATTGEPEHGTVRLGELD
jgi:hypothetical protein